MYKFAPSHKKTTKNLYLYPKQILPPVPARMRTKTTYTLRTRTMYTLRTMTMYTLRTRTRTRLRTTLRIRLVEHISVARVQPRTSKGITDVLLPQTPLR